jgi:hypothetical protein
MLLLRLIPTGLQWMLLVHKLLLRVPLSWQLLALLLTPH